MIQRPQLPEIVNIREATDSFTVELNLPERVGVKVTNAARDYGITVKNAALIEFEMTEADLHRFKMALDGVAQNIASWLREIEERRGDFSARQSDEEYAKLKPWQKPALRKRK